MEKCQSEHGENWKSHQSDKTILKERNYEQENLNNEKNKELLDPQISNKGKGSGSPGLDVEGGL